VLFAPEHVKQSVGPVDLQHGFQWRLSTVSSRANQPTRRVAGAAAAVPPPAPDPVAKYGGDRMDVERMESHVAKWLPDNCVDTNATVIQNVRLFMDHVSNVYKDKVAVYKTRGDMERLPPRRCQSERVL